MPLLAQGGRGDGRSRGGNRPPPPQQPNVGGGYIPQHAPARTPARRPEPTREMPPFNYEHERGHPNAPHVDIRSNVWVGHDVRRNEGGLRLERPWQYGHFEWRFGPSHVYRLNGGDSRRFGFGGMFFRVANVDFGYVNDWRWDNDDLVFYDDFDHPGYYLAYNVRTGTYVHVEYLGH